MSDQTEFVIKVRKPGRRAMLLSSGGRTTRLRVHAVRFADRARAKAHADDLASLNAGVAFEVAAA